MNLLHAWLSPSLCARVWPTQLCSLGTVPRPFPPPLPAPLLLTSPAQPLQPPLVYLSRLVPLALQDHLGLLAYRSLPALPPH